MSRPTRTSVARGVALAVALVALAVPARAQDAKAVVQQTMDRALAVLDDAGLSSEAKQGRLEAIADERFDFERMARLVLGRNRKKFSDEQTAAFLVEFRRHLSVTYGRSLAKFSDVSVEVGATTSHKNGDVTIKSVVVGGSADGVTMDYRMRTRDGSWYAIDVIIEGVSLIANFRSQIQEIVHAGGPDEVIRKLREKNKKDQIPEAT